MVLEFLGLKQESTYYEKDLETKIISHLQEFLLELGNGFAFMSRQKRIHLDGDDFFIDLVLYNRLLHVLTKYQLYLPSEKQLLDELRKVNESNRLKNH